MERMNDKIKEFLNLFKELLSELDGTDEKPDPIICNVQATCLNYSEKCPFPHGTDEEECPEFDYIYFKEKEPDPPRCPSCNLPLSDFKEENHRYIFRCECCEAVVIVKFDVFEPKEPSITEDIKQFRIPTHELEKEPTEQILGRIDYICKNCGKNICRKLFQGNINPFKIICLNCGFEVERSLRQWEEYPYV